MYVATYSQIHRAVTLGTCCSTWPAVLYFLFRQTRDSHVSQFYDQNFSGDVSRCTKALRGSHENRTRRPKLKTEGCTNLWRQVIVKTKNLFLRGGFEPKFVRFSVRELLHSGVLGGPEIILYFWRGLYRKFVSFEYGNCLMPVFWGPRNNSLFLRGLCPKFVSFSIW
jgi:hypothetical protein